MANAVLNDSLKATIQQAYTAWLDARGFRARRGQREMIAHIARILTGDAPRLGVIEAGTGTGKTAAYALAAIPIAAALEKRLLISSATIALQEQVVLRDLPDLQNNAGLKFSVAIAKGRQRYVCLKRLDERLKPGNDRGLTLFDTPTDEALDLYQRMLGEFGSKAWDGEWDSWADGVEEDLWRPITTDHRGCANNRCGFFRQCPFFRARARLDDADVVVANHDLVLADLSLGGGAVLPNPEDTIYIVDEAHHLPGKTQQHFSNATRLRASIQWLDSVNASVGSMAQRFGRPPEMLEVAGALAGETAAAAEALGNLTATVADLQYQPRDENLETHRFLHGEVDPEIVAAAAEARVALAQVGVRLDRAHDLVTEVLDGDRQWSGAVEAEDLLPVVGQLQGRCEAIVGLLENYAQAHSEGYARWANRSGDDHELVSAPIVTGELLASVFWEQCFAAVCTSATLTAVGRFDRFMERSGLSCEGLLIPSPFHFSDLAVLEVPAMDTDPRDAAAHTEEVARLLPDLLGAEVSALVLFTSWRQFNDVRRLLPGDLPLLCQGDVSKQALLDSHRSAIDRGERSYVFGLASFSEGVDLPDDYCRHVIVVKIPFAVPDDPLDQAVAEWVEAQGRNAFYEISVPDAALRLVQACGRLIRHEQDHGRITVLDRRIVTKRYGQALLRSLPPYRLQLND